MKEETKDRCPYCGSEFGCLTLCSPPKPCTFLKVCSNKECKANNRKSRRGTFGEWPKIDK